MASLFVIDDEPRIPEAIHLAFPDDEVTDPEGGLDACLGATPMWSCVTFACPQGAELFEKLYRVGLLTVARPMNLFFCL